MSTRGPPGPLKKGSLLARNGRAKAAGNGHERTNWKSPQNSNVIHCEGRTPGVHHVVPPSGQRQPLPLGPQLQLKHTCLLLHELQIQAGVPEDIQVVFREARL